ncbi:hypothetical protein ARMGADRAFT_1113267 [Armillaria gallica]|uniref:Uncharacterized protein n=1 Tax=Armillaria gallica TaxID=47427 RepID=A0A2H3DDF1_ARMGA|nr:hypothetical protein ARMGADRAFT_1113267 [Armillaria gallica]
MPSVHFPYCHLGKACFVCEHDGKECEVIDAAVRMCTHYQPCIHLDKSTPCVLKHVGAHIMFDNSIDNDLEPCSLCLCPAPVCSWYLHKGKGSNGGYQVNWKKSTCANKLKFNYNVAAAASEMSPCSNVPIQCKYCPDGAPAVWKYNMIVHIQNHHRHVS